VAGKPVLLFKLKALRLVPACWGWPGVVCTLTSISRGHFCPLLTINIVLALVVAAWAIISRGGGGVILVVLLEGRASRRRFAFLSRRRSRMRELLISDCAVSLRCAGEIVRERIGLA